jgi:tRNA (guanine26-N2/guanine27-N2)-dimethyltransferase
MKVPSPSPVESFNSRRQPDRKSALKVAEHLEGKTRLLVPSASLTEDPPPTSPVFFNPAAALNRDVTVAVTAVAGGTTFCDSMAGVGARGLRVAREVSRVERVVMVDFNGDALKLARRGAAVNRVKRKCEFADSETSSYLFSRYGSEQRFDFVDVDPFGSPVRQLQGALCATSEGGVLSVTATDTAVLCGVYPKVSMRRYGALPLNNHFHHETGARILIGAIARQGGSLDIGIEAVAAHTTRHYVRAFVRIISGATKAESALKHIGYVNWCPRCGHVESSAGPERGCAECGGRIKGAGPLWLGGLADQGIMTAARKAAFEMDLLAASEEVSSLVGVDGFPPWSFSIEKICSVLKVPTVPESRVYQNLNSMGHRAMRTPFEKTGVKTDARYAEVVEAVKGAARG